MVFAILENDPINQNTEISIKILLVDQQKHPQRLKIKSPPVFEGRAEPAVINLLPAELHDLYQLGQLAF